MTEEIKKCIEAQKQYCMENGLPVFIPLNGRCYRCGHQIFDVITLRGAGQHHITGCPMCHKSFCD